MKTTNVITSCCFKCGHVIEQASHAGTAVPYPGAFSLCIMCGAIMRFDSELRCCRLTDADVADLAACPEVALRLKEAQRRVRVYRASMN